MTQEVSRDELVGTVNRLRNDVEAATKAHEKALRDFERAKANMANTPTEEIVALVDAIKERKTAAGRAQDQLKVAENKIVTYDWKENSKDLTEAELVAKRDTAAACVNALASVIEKFGITSASISIVAGEGQLLNAADLPVSIKLTGTNIPKSPGRAPRAASSGNGVGRARYSYVVNGQSYNSRELVTAFADQLGGNVTAEMILAEPTKHGLTHKADALVKKLGGEKVAIEA